MSGVSGTGVVASGCVFDNGKAVVCWHGDHASTVIWDSIEDAIHIHGHDGRTQVQWLDGE